MAFQEISYLQQVRARTQDPFLYVIAAITLLIAVINISTTHADAKDYGAPLPFLLPIVSELSSALSLFILLPFVFAVFDLYPFKFKIWHKRLPPYIAISLLFSLLHIFLMILMREAAWPFLLEAPYNFFAGGAGELLYEYQKDAVSFILYAFLASLQRQLQTAHNIGNRAKDPLILKSGATTILLQPMDFLFAKSAGNYAEVTSISATQLARTTLTELETALCAKGCDAVRIHRSCLVNRTAIVETAPIAGGDLTVKLRGGEVLRASRRYKEHLTAFIGKQP